MEYKCLKCGAEFDVQYQVVCPDCGASGMNDLMPLRKWRKQQKIEDDIVQPDVTSVPVEGE